MSTGRELFEAWATSYGHDIQRSSHTLSDSVYDVATTQFAWQVWQAAKSSPSTEVVLPELPEPGDSDSKYDWFGRPFSYTAEDMESYARSAIALNRGEDAKRLDWRRATDAGADHPGSVGMALRPSGLVRVQG